jgi:hypothetical protein
MNGSTPSAIRILVPALLFAAFVISAVLIVFILVAGYPPLWAIGIVFAFLIVLVIVRIVAYAGFGYPRYDFYRQYLQNKSYLFEQEPEKALEAKYERNEITEEQYLKLLDDLRHKKG